GLTRRSRGSIIRPDPSARRTQIYPPLRMEPFAVPVATRPRVVEPPHVVGRPRPEERPLSLGPASRLLGVDPDTLRRGADEGRIEAFATAGGHRRFSRTSLERILQARRHDATIRLATLGATTDRLSRAYRRGYSDGAAASPVRDAVPPADREAFREDGR